MPTEMVSSLEASATVLTEVSRQNFAFLAKMTQQGGAPRVGLVALGTLKGVLVAAVVAGTTSDHDDAAQGSGRCAVPRVVVVELVLYEKNNGSVRGMGLRLGMDICHQMTDVMANVYGV